jgi:ribosomal protein S18 acetylase RimI-like enzyme
MTINVRKATESDTTSIWNFMKELAIFEHYIDIFAITPEIVIERGFQKSPPDFYCLVAEAEEKIVGILVYYLLPYTAQNSPVIYMKELFVDEAYRNQSIGKQLMHALKEEATQIGCTQIKWTVAPWNEKGIRFYEDIGAKENTDWLNFEWLL